MKQIIINSLSILISLLAILKIYLNIKKEHNKFNNLLLDSIKEMVLHISNTNNDIKDKVEKLIFLKQQDKDEILIKNQIQIGIIRDGLNSQQQQLWILEMINIFKENNIKHRKITIEKIRTKTNHILKHTDSKFRQIQGVKPYLIGYDQIITFLNKKNIYNNIYELLLSLKNKPEQCNVYKTCMYKLTRDLNNLWEITQDQLFNEYQYLFNDE